MTFEVRLGVAVACAVALVAGGVALDRQGPVDLAAGAPRQPLSGAWSCPHGGGEGWRVWVSVTNPGPDPVEVRMITAAGGTPSPTSTAVIPPTSVQQFEVPATLPGSATVVEYLGGTVVAGTVVVPPDGGLAAEPCAGSPGTRWLLAESSTLRGELAELVVHNPFSAQAVVDVILTAGDRHLRPGRLQGVVLGPREARAFELNHYALGQSALTATVIAAQGRVSAASVVTSAGGVRSSLAVAAPTTRWFLPGLGAEGKLVVRAQPDLDAPASAEVYAAEGPVPALDLEAVAAGTAEDFPLPQGDGFLVVRSDGDRPMIAGRRMLLEPEAPPQEEPRQKPRRNRDRRGQGDDDQRPRKGRGDRGNERQREEEPPPAPVRDPAATSGVAEYADRWIAPPVSTQDGGPAVLLVLNAGGEAVDVTVTFLGPSGQAGEPTTLSVLPRSTGQLPVPSGPAIAALVEGRDIVAAQVATAPSAFAVALGRPIG